MALAHNPKIVTDSLVLCLDAANPKSYPGSGTVWKDLSGNGNDGTLVNGVGFNSANKGVLTFDGVNDVCEVEFTIPSEYTIQIAVEFTGSVIGNRAIVDYGAGFSNQVRYYLQNSRFKIQHDNSFGSTGNFSSFLVEPSVIYFTAITYAAGLSSMYINGVLDSTQSLSAPSAQQKFAIANKPMGNGSGILPLAANVSGISVYNRALSADEISQNFQALRGRYGI
jgi:hypothetical protein